MITASSTLFRYISRQFLVHFAILTLILLGILLIFDTVESLRRTASMAQIPFGLILSMSFMKLPWLGERLLPVAVLFAAIYTCWKLNRTSELVVIRSAGLSVWQFLSPLVICALAIGFLSTTVLNPIASTFLSKHQRLDRVHFQNKTNLVTVSKTGIWLRQPFDHSEAGSAHVNSGAGSAPGGYALIHSENFIQKDWQLNKVTILFFDNDNNFLRRIDSPVTHLKDGYWEILQPLFSDKGGAQRTEIYKLPTELTSRKIEESFADPDTISFWNIPEYIHVMEETGFPATRLYIHFHALLAQPLLFVALIFLAATFSLRPPRSGGVASLIVLGIAAGFFIFFMEQILQAFGISQKIPAHLAAWSPALIGLLLGGTALLHLEDG